MSSPPKWSLGSWAYEWNANGSLKSVKKPSGQTISFEYDALGRRTKKFVKDKTIHYIWSGNVLLHEIFDNGKEQKTATYVYEQGSFVPTAKLINGESFSIVSDYLGTPVQAYDQSGNLIWERELDIYGRVRKEKGISNFVPFRYQGQYYDEETSLCYNRFRYYSPETGAYISQDPIGLLGNNPNFYAYVFDSNTEVDVFGLDCGKARKVKIGEEIAPNTTVKRIRQGTNGKAIVIGRSMDDRIIPAAKNINAEHWTGFDSKFSPEVNVANNRKWIEEKIADGYTVVDVGLDPRYKTSTGNMSLSKGAYYGVETEVAFGTRPVPIK